MFNFFSDIKKEHQEILQDFEGIFPVPLIEIAKRMNYKVMYFTPDENNFKVSGYINYGDDKIIGLNNNDGEYRRRFTLAHEIAHLLNGDNENEKFKIDYRDDIDGKSKDKKEILANKVGAELLMPELEFKKRFKEFKDEYHLKTIIFTNLSFYFGASEQAIEIRAKNLKLNTPL